MTTGQRAMASALVLADDGRREGGRWRRNSVDAIGESANSAWRARLKEAGIILDYAADLAEQTTQRREQDMSITMLDPIGLRPIIVPDLGRDALIFTRHGLVLLDADRIAAKPDDVIDQVIAAAMSTLE